MPRLPLLVLAATLGLSSCRDSVPTQPATGEPSFTALSAAAASAARAGQKTTLAAAVTGTATDALGTVGTFSGTEKITSFATDGAGTLIANVLVTGTAVVGSTSTPVSQAVAVPVSNLGTCPIVDLDLGAIHLDVLGLVVDLSPLHLDIDAQAGLGNLVGNLLCAIVHLLDISAIGTALLNLIALLNALLG